MVCSRKSAVDFDLSIRMNVAPWISPGADVDPSTVLICLHISYTTLFAETIRNHLENRQEVW